MSTFHTVKNISISNFIHPYNSKLKYHTKLLLLCFFLSISNKQAINSFNSTYDHDEKHDAYAYGIFPGGGNLGASQAASIIVPGQ